MARIALQGAGRYGFVLGGGLALILHGLVNRPTEDIDLFGPDTSSVVDAAAAVRAALQGAGIRVVDEYADSDLATVIDGMDYFMAEMIAYPDDRITSRDRRTSVSTACLFLEVASVRGAGEQRGHRQLDHRPPRPGRAHRVGVASSTAGPSTMPVSDQSASTTRAERPPMAAR